MNKQSRNWTYSLFIVGVSLMFVSSCKKIDEATLPETVTDVDGNVYHTVTIGTQMWMAENLKTTKFRNGDSIPNVTEDLEWGNMAAYCNYNNDTSYSATYGRLYNWGAANDSRHIAPAGWHVPTDAEWTTLTNYLGGESDAGGKLKETGTTHWLSPNTGATDEKGFTALPGGLRVSFGGFSTIQNSSCWWSSTEFITDTNFAWYRNININSNNVNRDYSFNDYGYSVRCIRD